AMDEEPLTRLQTPAVEDVGPNGEVRLRQRGRCREIDAVRNGKALLAGRGHLLGVPAAGDERTDWIADLPLATAGRLRRAGLIRWAAGQNVARDLETWNIGDTWRRRIGALPLHQIGTIDAGGRHSDEN